MHCSSSSNLSVCVFEPDAGPAVEAVCPALSILTADRDKVFLGLVRGKLLEAAVAPGRIVPVRRHLPVVVIDLVLQTGAGIVTTWIKVI